MEDLENSVQNTPTPKIGTSHRGLWSTTPLPKNRTSHVILRNFGPEYHPPQHTHARLELLMEDLETLVQNIPRSKKIELLIDNFLSWTGVWKLLLYPPRIPSCLVMLVVQPFSQPWHLFAHRGWYLCQVKDTICLHSFIVCLCYTGM